MVRRSESSRWLEKQGYESINPYDFYRFMFPEGELVEYTKDPKSEEANREWKYNGILLENPHVINNVTYKDANGVEHVSKNGFWKKRMVCDDLKPIYEAIDSYGKTDSEFIIAPISYLGKKRVKERERWMYACIIEVDHPITELVDGHRVQRGLEHLIYEWTDSPIAYLPPSAVVASGSGGLHLIYFLDRPYSVQEEHQRTQWDEFRRRFTYRIWNPLVSKAAMQYQNHCQAFRVVGTRTKAGQVVEAFWIEKERRYSIDELFSQVECDNEDGFEEVSNLAELFASKNAPTSLSHLLYVPDEFMKEEKPDFMKKEPKKEVKKEFVETDKMLKAKEKYPEWYQDRVIDGKPKRSRDTWKLSPKLYEWYFEEAQKDPFVGCRYHRVHALAQFALKCNIGFDKLQKDAEVLYLLYKDIDNKEPFTRAEFLKALNEYFNPQSIRSSRKWVESNAAIKMNPPAKRNGNNRKDHLHADRVKNEKNIPVPNVCKQNREAVLAYMRENGLITGRPVGSGTKQEIVQQWQKDNPDGKKADCIRETGLSKPTVLKWWTNF